MIRFGVGLPKIQEAFDHTNVKTTESYLYSFEVDFKKQQAKFLTAFKGMPDWS